MIIRLRALTRFESVLAAFQAGDDVLDTLANADRETFEELNLLTLAGASGECGRLVEEIAFWQTVHQACGTGHLARADRDRLELMYGSERVDSLARMLRSQTKTEAIEFIDNKSSELRGRLAEAPLEAMLAVARVT